VKRKNEGAAALAYLGLVALVALIIYGLLLAYAPS
jgi:hypothetical protein